MTMFSEFEYLHIFGLGLIVIFIGLRGLLQQKSLNEPPLVPYKYPIIGHTFEYYKDVPGFLKKCHEEYGEFFSLYIWGSVQTYVGNELYHEIFKKNQDFDFHEAFSDVFPVDTFLNRPDNFFKPLVTYLKEFYNNLGRFTQTVECEIVKTLDELIGDGKVIQPPLKTIQQIIARPIAATIVGKELCNDKELLNTFATITAELGPWLSIPPVLNFIYKGLHRKYIILKFRYLNNPIKAHRKIIIAKITPVINQRLIDQNELGNSWKRPDDVMQVLIETSKDHENNVDIGRVADFIMCFIFGSVHNTSATLAQGLCAYVNNPEYQKDLIDEADRIHSENEKLTFDGVHKMEKLDNFVKEILRLNRHDVSLSHKAISTNIVFSNGYQIPKGRIIHVITRHIHYDPKTYGPNPEKFNPNHHINSPATRPERNFLAFGMGKQACPGRFFAVNEVKIAMHQILLRYNIKSASGKYIEQKRKGGFGLVSDDGLLFEIRKNKNNK
ncbi:cytochrome P450 [Glomus cerebriforme]|uniref:Cytochrome P450 n=1 Tax=Glomus cerebriforme TaxID=658196 RepID=A0A397SNI5_9GLOM|nr:cytochrome P450 [Glomus cerebriforme]